MALNIKDPETERLAAEVARRTGENKTQAIRTALRERVQRLDEDQRGTWGRHRLREWLETEVWPTLPPDVRGKRLTKEEEEEILGIGPEGY